MKPFLMGSETEYAVSGRNVDGPLTARTVFEHLSEALRKERLWLDDAGSPTGLYLENGGRFYLDCGDHPEYATPECSTPRQVVACHDKAGERLLALASARAVKDTPGLSLTILKNNLNPIGPNEATWGTHESYTSWVAPEVAAAALLPHLVSRNIYAGAGCLSAYGGGNGFELSQRARHLLHATGSDTTGNRALFCTRSRGLKDRSERRGWARAHLVSKDSQRAAFGVYLTFGTTGLLFLLLNAGLRVGQGLELANAIPALRAISADPWLRVTVPLADGRRLTALQIQEAYLHECAHEVRKGGYPAWASEVVRHWRETLELLARDPLLLAARLDPYCKLLIFDHELRRAGCTWIGLRDALRDLVALRTSFSPNVLQALVGETPPGPSVEDRIDLEAAQARLSAGRRERLRLAVRLSALDVQYHQLGGAYDRLATAGHVQTFLPPAAVEHATRAAPAGSRAVVRASCVREFRGPGWICEWRYVYHHYSGTFVNLLDPFSEERRATGHLHEVATAHESDPEVREIHAWLTRK